MQVKVIEKHRTSFPNPIIFKKGEKVKVGKRDAEYLGWIRTKTQSGNEGWAPEQILKITDKEAIALDDYNAKELNTSVGERLTVHRELNEWYWVINSAGEFGWVPVKTVVEV